MPVSQRTKGAAEPLGVVEMVKDGSNGLLQHRCLWTQVGAEQRPDLRMVVEQALIEVEHQLVLVVDHQG